MVARAFFRKRILDLTNALELRRLGCLVPVIKLVRDASPGAAMAALSLTVCSGIIPVAMTWLARLIIDGVARHPLPGTAESRHLLVFILSECALAVLSIAIDRASNIARGRLNSKIAGHITLLIMRKVQELPLAYFDQPSLYDKLSRARRESGSRPISAVQKLLVIGRCSVTIVSFAAIIGSHNPMALLWVAITGIPAFAAETYFARRAFRLKESRIADIRRLRQYESVATEEEYAKENRLFGLSPALTSWYAALTDAMEHENFRLSLEAAKWTIGSAAFMVIAYGWFYAGVVGLTLTGVLSIGSMTMYLVAFRQMQSAFQTSLLAIAGVSEDTLYLTNLTTFLELEPTPLRSKISGQSVGEKGIRFDNVSFKYPGSRTFAVRNLSFFIEPNKTFALVGENAAGKTTLIKLLLGLYEPTEGRVWLDGKDMREWEELPLRQRFSALFQDFNKFQFSVRSNVGFGDLTAEPTDERILGALYSAGATSLSELVDGMDTQLGKAFHRGEQLSTGQWQRLSLARSIFRSAADIFVLDEPTSAIDAQAERELFLMLKTHARNRIFVIISHRYANVRIADEILVLEKGVIAERGTHSDLMTSRGLYARSFEVQAHGYS
jgi:ATP-binding cassette subfamily B protein